MKEKQNLPLCCQESSATNRKSFFGGIVSGLIPHTFCILFVFFTLIGSVIGMSIVKKFLAIPHFFSFLIFLSLLFASISAFIYLKKNKSLSAQGIKKNKKYLAILYGTTVLVNMLFVYYIFPAIVARATNAQNGLGIVNGSYEVLSIEVEIPCAGHASLIIDELKKTDGIIDVVYKPQNFFSVRYDAKKISEDGILSLEIFKTYKAIKKL